MTVQAEQVGHSQLVGGGATTLHSHAGGGGANVKQVETDFGNIPILEKEFIISDADVSATSQIIGGVAREAPTGKDLDELEMDMLDLKFAPGDGQFVLYAKGTEGYLEGKFKINYLIG